MIMGEYTDLKEECNFCDWRIVFILTSLEVVCYLLHSLSDWVRLSNSKSWHTDADCKIASNQRLLVTTVDKLIIFDPWWYGK